MLSVIKNQESKLEKHDSQICEICESSSSMLEYCDAITHYVRDMNFYLTIVNKYINKINHNMTYYKDNHNPSAWTTSNFIRKTKKSNPVLNNIAQQLSIYEDHINNYISFWKGIKNI